MKRLPLLVAIAATAGCGGGDPVGDVVGQPSVVTALEVQTRIFTPRCALSGCHAGPGAPFDLDLSSVTSSRDNTIDVTSLEVPSLMRVAPGNAPESYLFLKVTDDPAIQGDRMPASGPALTASEIALIETWIEQGAR